MLEASGLEEIKEWGTHVTLIFVQFFTFEIGTNEVFSWLCLMISSAFYFPVSVVQGWIWY